LRPSKKAYERYEAWSEVQKRVSSRPQEAWNWQWVRNRGQRLNDSHKASACRVSLGTYQRAMKILNELAVEAAKRGFEVEDETKLGRFAFVGLETRILLRIAEQLGEQQRTRIGYKGQKEVGKFQVPTGRLRITVGMHYRDGATFEDKDGVPLEDSLNKVFTAFYRLVVKERVTKRRAQFRDLIRAAETQKRLEAQRLLEQERARVAAEQRRRRELLREARQWENAQRIRYYVEHLSSSDSANSIVAMRSWARCALALTADIDPSIQRLAEGRQ
jgi:hypothetical protein